MIGSVILEDCGMEFAPIRVLQQKQGVNTYELGDDKQLYVEFYSKKKVSRALSKGGTLHFLEKDYVKIFRPNSRAQVDRQVRPYDKIRFARQWDAYKSGRSQQVGDSIEILQQQGLLTQGQVDMLRVASVFTIPQLAACSPNVIAGFGPDGANMVKFARGYIAYIEAVKGGGESLIASKPEAEAVVEKAVEAVKKAPRQRKPRLSDNEEGVSNV